MDAYHEFGTDLTAGANGDLLSVDGSDETGQRLLRRLYTPVTGYLWNLTYGAGLPQRVGDALKPSEFSDIEAEILAACAQEPGVAPNPAPMVKLNAGDNSLSGSISYTDAATQTPQVLYFPAGS